MSPLHDSQQYAFLTLSGANVQVRFLSCPGKEPELQIFGNRPGLFSIANVLLWFVANAFVGASDAECANRVSCRLSVHAIAFCPTDSTKR